MSSLSDDLIRGLLTTANVPIVFRGFVNDWPTKNWSLEKWSSIFGDKDLPFRSFPKDTVCDEPCWERRCKVISTTFKEFLKTAESSKEFMYFDYKYLHQWFSDTELTKELSWKQFGYPDKTAMDTTLWIGNKGAHTPAHQDTYGVNIVSQLYGKKRWILFPPETGGLKPTRVPYEESSVYSELNFYCPHNLDSFKGLTGGKMVELSAGDALFVPRGWWHYVQNMDTVNISVNCWIPHEKDVSTHVSEALIKIFVAQMCKDLPKKTAELILNPNEDDISDTPLAVLFLQLDTVAKTYLETRRKSRRIKRQRMREDEVRDDDNKSEHESKTIDVDAILKNGGKNVEAVPPISSENVVSLIKNNIQSFVINENKDEDDVDKSTSSLCLTKAVIDSFCSGNVIDIVRDNLFARLDKSYE